ncbi:WD repeat-containing protein 70-like [Schistocerca gregaria]|uniref:WD repeat-containing protein 70-like n=1 Tax=Schistocerca gregaria TaxID=7010 RepID=UPI00211E4A05|nr:WD repeat-containing protein 70-like [Schistocerca gregaria]
MSSTFAPHTHIYLPTHGERGTFDVSPPPPARRRGRRLATRVPPRASRSREGPAARRTPLVTHTRSVHLERVEDELACSGLEQSGEPLKRTRLKSPSDESPDSEDREDSDESYGPSPPPPSCSYRANAEIRQQAETPGDDGSRGAFDQFLKRKHVVKPKAKKPLNLNKSDPVYVYGKDQLPQEVQGRVPTNYEQQLDIVSKTIPQGEIDHDTLNDNPLNLPITHEVLMYGHTRAVSALSYEFNGHRLVSGGYDYALRFWDFNTMSRNLQSFRTLEPCGNYLIHSVEWNKSGDKILLGSASPQAKILDREGHQLVEFIKGHQYNVDMANTLGHTLNITKAIWHATDRNCVITGALDSTVRLWDVNESKKHKLLIKIKNDRGFNQARVYALVMDARGKYVTVASEDGSIQLFAPKAPCNRPTIKIPKAHEFGTETSGLSYYPNDENLLLSRGGDDTMKAWDLRSPKTALKCFDHLPNRYAETNIVFSPDAKIILTATSTTREGAPAMLAFFDAKTLTLCKQTTAASESVLSLFWHAETNQILAGSADGVIRCFFSPTHSKNGVLKCLLKSVKRHEEIGSGVDILTPHALPIFQDTITEKQRRKQALKDPKLSHKPLEVKTGAGSQGFLGTSLKAEFMKKILKATANDPHEDPREALLKHHDKTAPQNLNQLDYEALERINRAELDRAEQIEKLRKQRERK